MREYTKNLRDLFDTNPSDEKITALIHQQMTEIYKIVGICLGIPSETFTWQCYDKSKNLISIGPITPLQFYQEHVRQHFNVNEKVYYDYSYTLLTYVKLPTVISGVSCS